MKVERAFFTICAAVCAAAMVASVGGTFLAHWWYGFQAAFFAAATVACIGEAEYLDDCIGGNDGD